MEAEFENVGVGLMQIGAYGCDNCHAFQISPYHYDNASLNPWEKDTGFYEPDEMVGEVGLEPTVSCSQSKWYSR